MKHVRFVFALTSLAALNGCNSIYLTNSEYGKARRAALKQQPAAEATPEAPVVTAPVEPVAPAPVVVEAAPVMPPPAPVPVVIEPAPPVAVAVVPAPVALSEPGLRATRSGLAVKLDWKLPEVEGGYRSIEIMRNTSAVAQGRGRVRAVRASLTELEDTVPLAGERYWYWLKLTAADGRVSNMGPVEAAEVR